LVSDGISCIDVKTVTVNVVSYLPVFAGPNTSICEGESVQLTAAGGTTYTWSPPGSLSNANISNPVADPTMSTAYSVSASTGTCFGSTILSIDVGNATATAGQDASICAGGSAQLQGQGGPTYVWAPSASLDDAFISNPVASPGKTTTYSLVATRD